MRSILRNGTIFGGAGYLAAAMALLTMAAPVTASAYIPSSQTISGRLVRSNGKGIYSIEQEVRFKTATDTVVLREQWIVEDGDRMRVIVSSPKGAAEAAKFDVVYRNGKRTAPDLSGGVKTSNLPAEFLESFLHARSSKGFLSSLVRARIVPPSFLKARARVTNASQLKDLKYEPEPLVGLARTSGAVAWVFGEPTPADAAKANPAAWIEQDAFNLLRLRFPSQAEMTAEKHSVFSSSIRLPRERTVTWNDSSVTIKVLSAKPMAKAQAAKLLDPSSLTAAGTRLPELAQVREFYSRFR